MVPGNGFEHNVARPHGSVEAAEVIIPAKGGRVSIIDFSVSVCGRYSGVDYITPYIRGGKLQANSCGTVALR